MSHPTREGWSSSCVSNPNANPHPHPHPNPDPNPNPNPNQVLELLGEALGGGSGYRCRFSQAGASQRAGAAAAAAAAAAATTAAAAATATAAAAATAANTATTTAAANTAIAAAATATTAAAAATIAAAAAAVDVSVEATFDPGAASVLCVTPPGLLGRVAVRVSLNAQQYSALDDAPLLLAYDVDDVSTIAPFGEEQLAQVAAPAELDTPPTPYERGRALIGSEEEGLGVRPSGAPPRFERDVRPDSYVSLDGDTEQHGLNAYAMFEDQSRYSENWAGGAE